MNFDASRMAKLAGLSPAQNSKMLSEAGNRSMHDDPGVAGEDEHRYGKGQLAEAEHDEKEEGMHYEMDHAEEGHGHDMMEEPEEGDHMEEGEDEDDLDELHPAVVGGLAAVGSGALGYAGSRAAQAMDPTVNENTVFEIDENMLRSEIRRMRQERQEHLNEERVRNVVRKEIRHTLQEMDEESLNSDSSWLYGDNKPKNSKRGNVAVGAFGIGFKDL
jgi:hypothetical protein